MNLKQLKILLVVTNKDRYETVNRKTGLWIGEFVNAYTIFKNAGYSCDVVSPEGGSIPIDPESLKKYATDKSVLEFYNNVDKMKLLNNTLAIIDLKNVENYACIFYTGGHGTMWDFPNNLNLQIAAKTIYENEGYVAAVCHGVSGLLNIKLTDGSYLIKDKKITGYANIEEVFGNTKKIAPYSLQNELKKRGANYKRGLFPFVSKTHSDKRVLTGQNPFSTKKLAQLVVKELTKKYLLSPVLKN